MAGDDDKSENKNDDKGVKSDNKMGVIEKSFSSSTCDCDIKASKHLSSIR